MSQFFRKGGIALNDTEWIQDFADRRLQYGVSQTKLAVMAGISREHLSRIESGKVAVTEEMKVKLLEALEKFNPEAPLTMLFDYVKIRFPTLDIFLLKIRFQLRKAGLQTRLRVRKGICPYAINELVFPCVAA